MLPGVNVQATIKAVGTPAVLVVSLAAVYGIAALSIEPWLKVVLAVPPTVLIGSGAFWLISGGEQGTTVDIREGRVSIKNLNILAHPIVRAALDVYSRAPLPPPAGEIGPGSPADRASIIEGRVSLPEAVEVVENPIVLPPGGGVLP